MGMTSREIVKAVVRFNPKERIAYDFPGEFGSDFAWAGPNPSPDVRSNYKNTNCDEWGARWENIGICQLGEVKEFPLLDWADLPKLNIPDIKRPDRWAHIGRTREEAGDKFLMGNGISIYERVHFIRSLENTWIDIHENPDKLCWLLDLLVEMNLYCIERYKEIGADGYIFCDDWGLQDRLMIAPDSWRKFWKPRYATIYKAAREANLITMLHSCGYITDILDDLIEIGLDVIHMDQQVNMGLETLGKRFAGRITFFSPVDIQLVLPRGDLDEIRAYCRAMYDNLWRNGGFIPRWYSDPVGAGISKKAGETSYREFLRIGAEIMKGK